MSKTPWPEPAAETFPITRTQLIDLIRALKDEDEETIRKRADIEAEAIAKATGQQAVRPDPGVSVYSYPEGEQAHPKPPFRCKMFWVGHRLKPETTTADEMDLLNRVEPGEYWITKTDGTRFLMTVTPRRDSLGRLDQITFSFPVKGRERDNLPSMADILRQALGESSEAAALAEVARLRTELETLRAGG